MKIGRERVWWTLEGSKIEGKTRGKGGGVREGKESLFPQKGLKGQKEEIHERVAVETNDH